MLQARCSHPSPPPEKNLSLIYLAALIAVSLALLGALVEAVWAVTRKPVWGEPRRTLAVITTMERRTQSMPFIGTERRHAAGPEERADKGRIAA